MNDSNDYVYHSYMKNDADHNPKTNKKQPSKEQTNTHK